ncbi:MAG: M20 family metallopeptidase [Ruminococcaceae bacterium]|nr:M20 family metallopeptidase [Oscillospiraceae bacterium]
MDLVNRISDWVDAHENELIEDIKRSVRIKSVRGEAEEGAPFGRGPRQALSDFLVRCEDFGFATGVVADCVGTADIKSDKPAKLDILVHLDVVPADEGWESDPYLPEVRDGMLYGRGTDDDKGPAVMALYAMRCISELGLSINGNCRLILGTDEESGMGDLPHYYNKYKPAPCTFSPDAGFPVFNVEKGSYRPTAIKTVSEKREESDILWLKGGHTLNIVPELAEAEISGISAHAAELYLKKAAADLGLGLEAYNTENGAVIQVLGKSAHASLPEQGNNAVTGLLQLIKLLPLDTALTAEVSKISKVFPHGDNYGVNLGIANEDDLSGKLTLVLSVIDIKDDKIVFKFDSRVPLSSNEENCKELTEKRLGELGYTVKGEQEKGHHTSADSDFVKTLLTCYETYSGNKGECLSMGGGTYVHGIPGAVAFGATFPGFEANMHGIDEKISVKDALSATKIFALAIARICCGD